METIDNGDFRNDLVALLIAVAMTIAFGLLTSCKTKYVSVPEIHTSNIHTTDTAHVYHRDSIYMRDSVFTTVYINGDTVYNVAHHYHYNTQWRDRVTYQSHSDTLRQTDTITVVKPVVAELSKTQRRLITVGKLALGIGVAVIMLAAAVRWYRRKT